MERRYASAGPNKQMYEMYNLSVRNTMGAPSEPYFQTGMPSLAEMRQGPEAQSTAIMGRTDSLAKTAGYGGKTFLR